MTFAARRPLGEVISPPGPPPPPPAEVVLLDGNYVSLVFEPATATFTYSVRDDGFVVGSANSGGSQSYEWLTGTGSVSDYDVRWTPTPGSAVPDTGTTSTWLNLGTTRTWSISRTASGGQAYGAVIEIRETSTGTVLADADLSIFLEVVGEIPL